MIAAKRIIGYIRVSTLDQADSGLGLAAQRAELERHAAFHGWDLTIVADEGRSGASLRRAGIRRALRALAQGQADGLAVAKLDRLSRSAKQTAELAAWFQEAQRELIVIDLGLDTSTLQGQFVLQVMAAMAELERGLISQRTKSSLKQLRAQGKPISRPAVHDHNELAERVRRMHAQGITKAEIARRLNAEGVPTLRGGTTWRASSLQSVLGYERPPKRRERSNLPTVSSSRGRRR